jgi:hypothetical protein
VKRQHVAFLLLAIAGVALTAFYANLGGEGPTTEAVVLVAIATALGRVGDSPPSS